MNRDTLNWSAFVAALVPLFLRQSGDPVMLTAVQIAGCIGAVFLSSWLAPRG